MQYVAVNDQSMPTTPFLFTPSDEQRIQREEGISWCRTDERDDLDLALTMLHAQVIDSGSGSQGREKKMTSTFWSIFINRLLHVLNCALCIQSRSHSRLESWAVRGNGSSVMQYEPHFAHFVHNLDVTRPHKCSWAPLMMVLCTGVSSDSRFNWYLPIAAWP